MGTLTNLAGDLVTDLTGYIEKAYIDVKEENYETNVDEARRQPTGSSNLLSKVTSALTTAVSSVTGGGDSKGRRRFIVMFNPSSLHFSGIGGGRRTVVNYEAGGGAGGNQINDEGSLRITLDVRLIFDKVLAEDAFMGDKFIGTGLTDLATSAASALVSAASGESARSVQPEVEAFTSMVQNDTTRDIIFSWGKLSYEGYVDHITTNYTMFNPSAQPIRAEVDLSMVCYDKDVGRGNMGSWEKSYTNAFSKTITNPDGTTETVGRNLSNTDVTTAAYGQYASNLLNINW